MHHRLSRSLLSASILSALLPPALAAAQQTPATETTAQAQAGASPGDATQLDAVQVTALRQSLETAQNIKRDSDMVDSIVAEDIGKLPDNSVADALQRVTGVQITRGTQGETTGVVIRGLPDVISTLNGREIFSSSGRGYAFQNLPATAVKTLSVYKTSEVQLPLGGIAGVVDLQLRRPFDFDGREVAATYNAVQSKYGGSLDPNASLLLCDRWDTGAGEFDALVNFGYIEKEYAYDAVWGDFPKVLTDGSSTEIRTDGGDLIAAANGFGTAYNTATASAAPSTTPCSGSRARTPRSTWKASTTGSGTTTRRTTPAASRPGLPLIGMWRAGRRPQRTAVGQEGVAQ